MYHLRRSYFPARRRGFTMLELVVVVLILGIIAAIAAPKMFDAANDARDSSAKQSLDIVRDAIQMHRCQNGAYPGDAGTGPDFRADVLPFLRGKFPKCPVGAQDRKVRVYTSGNPLSAGGVKSWAYDNVTGEFIINHASYETW